MTFGTLPALAVLSGSAAGSHSERHESHVGMTAAASGGLAGMTFGMLTALLTVGLR